MFWVDPAKRAKNISDDVFIFERQKFDAIGRDLLLVKVLWWIGLSVTQAFVPIGIRCLAQYKPTTKNLLRFMGTMHTCAIKHKRARIALLSADNTNSFLLSIYSVLLRAKVQMWRFWEVWSDILENVWKLFATANIQFNDIICSIICTYGSAGRHKVNVLTLKKNI